MRLRINRLIFVFYFSCQSHKSWAGVRITLQ